jgi:hypothetical protein
VANVKTNHRSRESAAKTVIRLQRSKLRATMLLPMRLRRQLERLQAISNNRNKMATSVEVVVAETRGRGRGRGDQDRPQVNDAEEKLAWVKREK